MKKLIQILSIFYLATTFSTYSHGQTNDTDSIDSPKLTRENFKINVSDREAQPLVRVPGKVPDRALIEGMSGHCKMRFDVNASGIPFNINAYFCSHRMFERESIQATSKFKYNPKIVDGTAVPMRGVETKITYRVADELGRILPEHGPEYSYTSPTSVAPTPTIDVNQQDGQRYKGQFVEGKLAPPKPDTGPKRVSENYPGGGSYHGIKLNGKPHGEGRLIIGTGEYRETHEGEFVNGLLISGRKEFYGGSKWVEGEFTDDSDENSWGPYGGLLNGKYYAELDTRKIWGHMTNGKPSGRHTIEREFDDGTVRISGYLDDDGQIVSEKCTIVDTGRSCMSHLKRRYKRKSQRDDIVSGLTDILNAIILSQ